MRSVEGHNECTKVNYVDRWKKTIT